MRHPLLVPLAVVLAVVSSVVATHADSAARCFLCDCAAFDRAYVPALLLSDQGDLDGTRAALRVLRDRVGSFKTTYYERMPEAEKWKADIREVDQRVIEANRTAGADADVPRAHQLLKEIPPYFTDMRVMFGIGDYYLDPLFKLHAVLDQMDELTQAQSAASLSGLSLSGLQDLQADSLPLLKQIQDEYLDTLMFQLRDAQVDAIKGNIITESRQIEDLGEALKKGDKQWVLDSEAKLKPTWQAIMKPFGDFAAVDREARKLQPVPMAPGL